MFRQISVVCALVLIPIWWIFHMLWQPALIHLLAASDSPVIDRAIEYATLGSQATEDIFFDALEISHLNDVSRLVRLANLVLNLGAGIAWSVLLVAAVRRIDLRRSLTLASRILLGLFLVTVMCLLVFAAFFQTFHLLLFPQGNWAFPESSALIRAFPESFWRLVIVAIASQIALVIVLYRSLGKRE